jgi:hypothetical protein
VDEQRASLAAAGIDVDAPHPPVYVDLLKPGKKLKSGVDPLTLRAAAIKSLRRQDTDELVVHDAATLGLDLEDITLAMSAIGKRGGKLIVWTPEPREFTWHPDAAEVMALAVEGAQMMRSEKHRRAGEKNPLLGAPAKLAGKVLEVAKAAWADPALTSKQAAEKVKTDTGVKVSVRLLFDKLGKKSDAEGKLT